MPNERNSKHDHHSHRSQDWFLESFLGQIVYAVTKKKQSWYPEEHEDWEVPEKYLKTKGQPEDSWKKNKNEKSQNQNNRESLSRESSDNTVVGDDESPARRSSGGDPEKKAKKQQQNQESQQSEENSDDVERQDNSESEENKEEDPNLVTWYGPNDTANPQNWSLFKKCCVTAEMCILTFSVYIGSAIYSPGYESLNRDFGISSVVATLGLTLFVIGYGIGPLFLAPLSEIPAIGRTPPYIITLFLFLVLQPITATVQNVPGLFVLRFLAGFIGSPVLATGGASIGDMFGPKTRPFAIGIWGLAAIQGPVLGPLLGGFAIQAKNWRWAFWILTWLSGGCLALIIFALPETSTDNILLRRARRLRKRTGNENLKSQGEIDSAKMSKNDLIKNTLWMPIWLSVSEPIVFALNLYIGLVYAILYVWIESFQLVFVQVYGFNLGENGLAYLGLVVGGVMAYIGFAIYNAKVTIPEIRKTDNKLPPERRLPLAMAGAWLLPIGIFGFGATGTISIHWIAPILMSCFFSAGAFLLFQGVLNYLQDAYPTKAASILAGNDFFRSMMGAAFPLFAPALFNNLRSNLFPSPQYFPTLFGCVLLGCLTILFIPIPYVLYKYGRKLRERSPNARQDL